MNEQLLQMILNSLGGGPSAQRLARAGGDPGALRPWLDPRTGRSYVTLNTRQKDKDGGWIYKNYATNTPATMTREQWLEVDREVAWQAKQRLVFAADIAANKTITIPNGFGKLAYQYWVADGDADAIVSMDPVRRSERSRPSMDGKHIPLPVIHSDGSFTARQLAVAADSQMPLDTTGLAFAGRKIGEIIEQMYLGTTTWTFAEGTIYGAQNAPGALSTTFTSPETGGWEPNDTYLELLFAFKILEDKFFRGPYALYYSNGWDPFFDQDYSAGYQGPTLRQKIQSLPKIRKLQNVDYLPDFKMILIDITNPNVFAAIRGMPITTVQWQEEGGMVEQFKVMTIDVPLVRQDWAGYTGILNISASTPTTTTTSTTSTTTTTT